MIRFDIPAETKSHELTLQLMAQAMEDCLEHCTPIEASKVRLAMDPAYRSEELENWQYELLAGLLEVARTNAGALMDLIIHGDCEIYFRALDADEEQD